MWNKRKIIILPNQLDGSTPSDFANDLKEASICAALIVTGEEQPIVYIPKILAEVQGLLSKF